MAFLGLLRYLVSVVVLFEIAQGRHIHRGSYAKYGKYEGDNSLDPTSPEYDESPYESSSSRNKLEREFTPSNWVNATQKPSKTIVVNVGERVELTCEALGNPSPSIQWFRGSTPVTGMRSESSDDRLVNLLPDVKIGKVVSKFVIACAEKQHQGSYTCVATSGLAETRTHATRLIVEGPEPGEKESLLALCRDYRFKPEIVLTRPLAFESYGNNVFLPCSAIGNPKPRYRWENEDGKPINPYEDDRFQITKSGDLLIYNLEWDDMGKYYCIAYNEHGEKNASTFVYPVNPK